MKDAFKLVSWLSIITVTIACVISSLINDTVGTAIAFGIMGAVACGLWGAFLVYLFGVRRRIKRFLGISLKNATFLDKEVGATRINDVRQALESLYKDKSSSTARYGIKFGYNVQLSSLQEGNTEVSKLQWTTAEIQPGEYQLFPTNALYLLRWDDIPCVVCLNSSQEPPPWDFEEEAEGVVAKNGQRLQVFAQTLDDAAKVLNLIMAEASARSVYRGKMLHVSPRGPSLPGHFVRVAELPKTHKDRIVLPVEVLEVIHRAVLTRLRFSRLLQHHGHTSKTAILLHGLPGTGKTLVTKYLINLCENHTAIIPTGMETETIREAFRMAVYLQPSIIVIEDVDLLAERRETNANVTGLQELLNEMDGLTPSTDAIILMSTNRPEVLEPALASRPGRVSQAVSFPLPSTEHRERLLRLFAASTNIDQLDVRRWVKRTDGASPAFLEELVKRSIIIAAERVDADHAETPLDLIDQDFDQAIHELVVFGGTLTSNVLGFVEG
ncbi:MAG: AAA family ATPase [Pirellulaceae bacterium]